MRVRIFAAVLSPVLARLGVRAQPVPTAGAEMQAWLDEPAALAEKTNCCPLMEDDFWNRLLAAAVIVAMLTALTHWLYVRL